MTAGDGRIPPSEEPEGGLGPLAERMDAMKREAEAIIDRARATNGEAAPRYALAAMEIHFAMRDEFGPANAALYGARGKKLQELAGAVGMTSAPEPTAFPIDDFVRETRSFAERLREKGFEVTGAPVLAKRIDWRPAEAVGWRLAVTDPKRTIDEDVPYAGTPHGPPKAATPKKIHPSVSLYVFPHVRLSASESMVARAQPGTPVSAGAATVFFRLPLHDQDPGRAIGDAVETALFGEAKPREHPAAAKALGGGTAALERGILRVSGRGEPPGELPDLGVPEARIVLWSVQQGADIDHTLIPRR